MIKKIHFIEEFPQQQRQKKWQRNKEKEFCIFWFNFLKPPIFAFHFKMHLNIGSTDLLNHSVKSTAGERTIVLFSVFSSVFSIYSYHAERIS